MSLHIRSALAIPAMAAALGAAALIPASAHAATLNFKSDRVDILLNGNETANAASGLAGTAWTCRYIIGGAAVAATSRFGPGAGYIAGVSAGVACIGTVAPTAVSARIHGKWAGFTVKFRGVPGIWGWTY